MADGEGRRPETIVPFILVKNSQWSENVTKPCYKPCPTGDQVQSRTHLSPTHCRHIDDESTDEELSL